MSNVFRNIKNFFNSLAFGMRAADNIIANGDTVALDNVAGIHKEVHENRVSKDLLKGEVTQQVKELRYRTYQVDREAKGYEFFSPTLAKKYEGMKDDSKFVKYENSDNLEVITIQPNDLSIDAVNPSLNDVTEDGKYIDKPDALKEYTIHIERSCFTRFRLEEFTKRLVVKKTSEGAAVLDFYVSKYPNPDDIKSKAFISEIERIMNGGRSSDVFDFDRVRFTTIHAYRVPDMFVFCFRLPIFLNILEYDGHYIIKFRCVVETKYDGIDEYYEPVMAEKYKNKEKKEVTLDLDAYDKTREYVCERCGKVMIYDPLLIESINATEAREIDEEVDETRVEALAYLDAEMSEQTTGHVFCKECLKKYLEENGEIIL